MTATAASDTGSDLDHWPDDSSDLQRVAVAAPGYDSHNGLRSHTYISPKPAPASPKSAPPAYNSQVVYYQQAPQLQLYAYQPNVQYTYGAYAPAPAQTMAYPGAAYYSYGAQPVPVAYQQATAAPAAKYHVYQPAYTAPTPAPAAPQGNVWVGRTKAQVDEDNMKIAKSRGAYDKRKVVPTGVEADQMMWCVETDGSHTLRTFVSIKELKGEWKKDPRYEESYYFIRAEEEEEGED